eukprot:scaffold34623_cov274-Amphora_coffeaeformis.AAC.12
MKNVPHFGRIGTKDKIIVCSHGPVGSIGGLHGRIGFVSITSEGRLDDAKATQGFARALEGCIRLQTSNDILFGRKDIAGLVRGNGRSRGGIDIQ